MQDRTTPARAAAIEVRIGVRNGDPSARGLARPSGHRCGERPARTGRRSRREPAAASSVRTARATAGSVRAAGRRAAGIASLRGSASDEPSARQSGPADLRGRHPRTGRMWAMRRIAAPDRLRRRSGVGRSPRGSDDSDRTGDPAARILRSRMPPDPDRLPIPATEPTPTPRARSPPRPPAMPVPRRRPRRMGRHPTLRHVHTVPPISLRRPPWPTRRFPDKPALEGLEAKWSQKWDADGTFLFDRLRAAEVGRAGHLLRRHSPADGIRVPAHRARLLVHAHRHQGAVRADDGQDGVLPHGLGRQRPADRAPRAELLRRAVRPVAPLRRRLHPSVRGRRQQELPRRGPDRDQPPQLHRAVRAAHGRGREGLRGALARPRPLRRLDPDLPHDLGRDDPHVAARLPAQPRARRGLPVARADPLGHRLPLRDRAGRARGPRPARRLPPHRLPRARGRRVHRDDPSGAARRLRGARGASG